MKSNQIKSNSIDSFRDFKHIKEVLIRWSNKTKNENKIETEAADDGN